MNISKRWQGKYKSIGSVIKQRKTKYTSALKEESTHFFQ